MSKRWLSLETMMEALTMGKVEPALVQFEESVKAKRLAKMEAAMEAAEQ